MVKQCCVPCCEAKGITMRSFPSSPNMSIIYTWQDCLVYKLWVKRVGRDLRPKKEYYICDKHFANFCRSPGTKRLKYGSLPSLFLPGMHVNSLSASNIKYEEALDTSAVDVEPSCTPEQDVHCSPATCAEQEVEDFEWEEVDEEETMGTFIVDVEPTCASERDVPCTLATNVKRKSFLTPPFTPATSTKRKPFLATPSTPAASAKRMPFFTPPSRKNLFARSNLCLKLGVRRRADLTPKSVRLLKLNVEMKRFAKKLVLKNKSLGDRLKAADDIVHDSKFSNLFASPIVHEFVKTQIDCGKKKPGGRRFSEATKIMSLALMKNFGKRLQIIMAFVCTSIKENTDEIAPQNSIQCQNQ